MAWKTLDNGPAYKRTPAKSARLIALAEEIGAGTFDPDTVNMSDLAGVLGVHRSTVMRDLADLAGVQAQIDAMRASIRNCAASESFRRG